MSSDTANANPTTTLSIANAANSTANPAANFALIDRRAANDERFGERPQFAKGPDGKLWLEKPVLPQPPKQWPRAILPPSCSSYREAAPPTTIRLDCGDAVLMCGSTLHAGPAVTTSYSYGIANVTVTAKATANASANAMKQLTTMRMPKRHCPSHFQRHYHHYRFRIYRRQHDGCENETDSASENSIQRRQLVPSGSISKRKVHLVLGSASYAFPPTFAGILCGQIRTCTRQGAQ